MIGRLCIFCFLFAGCSALSAGDTLFFSTPGIYPFIIPSGTGYLKIYLSGACGGKFSTTIVGGLGGTLNATIFSLSWGTNMTIRVGSQGRTGSCATTGFNGGGSCTSFGGAGGGATDLRHNSSSLFS